MENMNKYLLFIAIMISGIVAVLYFNLFKPPIISEKLVIADASQMAFTLLYIAKSRGYLKKEGLEVTYKKFTSGRDALRSVIQSEADIATVFETPVVLQTYAGHKLSVISTLHDSNRNTLLIVRADRDINHPMDLTGKRIAVSKNTNGEFFLKLFLVNHGIDEDQVSIVNAKPPEMATLLKNGTVDAVATWNPHAYNARMALAKDNTRAFYSDVYTEFSVLAGLREVILKRSTAMEKLLKALLQAERFLAAHPKKSMEIVMKNLSDTPEETIRETWNDINWEIQLDNVMLSIFKLQGEWFHNSGRFDTPVPDFREVIFKDYLQTLKLEAVTVY
jgi:ABC-type nitrate/sulfonate/bicarbonate transport system substrate-binding protein